MDELTLSDCCGLILWAIEGVIEGNTFREILVGPLVVLLGACAVFLIDRWVGKSLIGKRQDRPANANGVAGGGCVPKHDLIEFSLTQVYPEEITWSHRHPEKGGLFPGSISML
jgi:hypothetical protein